VFFQGHSHSTSMLIRDAPLQVMEHLKQKKSSGDRQGTLLTYDEDKGTTKDGNVLDGTQCCSILQHNLIADGVFRTTISITQQIFHITPKHQSR
jgi:hypothetical protein